MTYTVINGALYRNGAPAELPKDERPCRTFRGLGGAVIEHFYKLGLRRITRGGETWWQEIEDRKFIGPAAVRKEIAERERAGARKGGAA